MTPDELRRRVGALVAAVLALHGCAGDWPDDTWDLPTCDGTDWAPLAALDLPAPPDWLALASAGVDSPADVSDELGARCGGATDAEACEAAVTALEADLGFRSHLLATTGDAAEGFAGRDDVRALLGTIDNPDEALVLAWADGDSVTCGDREQSAQRVSPDGGFDVVTTHYRSVCSPIVRVRTQWHVTEDGEVEALDEDVISRSLACIGRRPPGLGPAEPSTPTVGAWLARAAELEAAAVPAFERLAAELAALGAPAELVADARAAADDERRHVRAMTALARRYGAEPVPRPVADLPLRSLRDVALDNAVEGCVREAWGAVLGTWQARTATDPVVRAVLTRVADDEVGHAALSARVAAWVATVADEPLRHALAEATARALAEVAADVERPLPEAARGPLGLPDARIGAELFSRFASGRAAA
jgi:hypothetical protein